MWQSCYRIHLAIIPDHTTNGPESINFQAKHVDDIKGYLKIHQVCRSILSN